MKDININYDALSFEEKVNLKLNYMYSLPRTESSIRTGIVTLSWIKTLLIDERIEPDVFIQILVSRMRALMRITPTEEVKSELINLQWVIEAYQEELNKGVTR